MLADLEARGVRTDRAMLFVIDGSKALAKAIRVKYGSRALIQRCQVHKMRNVEDHLSEELRKTVGRTVSAAYKNGYPTRAKFMLQGLARQLERKHPSAATSLREGLEETLTVMHFQIRPGPHLLSGCPRDPELILMPVALTYAILVLER